MTKHIVCSDCACGLEYDDWSWIDGEPTEDQDHLNEATTAFATRGWYELQDTDIELRDLKCECCQSVRGRDTVRIATLVKVSS